MQNMEAQDPEGFAALPENYREQWNLNFPLGWVEHRQAWDPAWNPENPDPATSSAPYRIYNIGNNSPVALLDYIACIEKATGRKAILEMVPAQPGDVPETYADVEALKADVGFKPATPLKDGVDRFVAWYRDYYRV